MDSAYEKGIFRAMFVLAVLTLLDIGGTTWLVARQTSLPMKEFLQHPLSLIDDYDVKYSFIDICAFTWIRGACLLFILSSAHKPHNGETTSGPILASAQQTARNWRSSLVLANWVLGSLILIAKTIVFALGGGSARLAAGLTLGGSLLCLGGETRAAVLILRSLGSSGDDPALQEPLLSAEEGGEGQNGLEKGKETTANATIWNLLRLSVPDLPFLCFGFVMGLGGALGTSLVPFYCGKIVDAAAIEADRDMFQRNINYLTLASVWCAVFVGLRGGTFTFCAGRLLVRIRRTLMQSLLIQEVGFFDVTKTGDITSRLSSDTTTVADQVSLNLNVLMRSVVQVLIVVGFMVMASWRLTLVTLVMVPFTILISKVYGSFYLQLAKQSQAEVAEVNSTAEEAIASMSTVKAHAAQRLMQCEFDLRLMNYFHLQRTEAAAYALYNVITNFLPNAVTVLVLLYGGNMVLHKTMSAGDLVSFMYYQQTLTNSFQNIGDIFTGLTAAVGAADKVFELMRRKPKLTENGTAKLDKLQGELEFRGVHFTYAGRPNAPVLRGLTLHIPPGQVCALVGPSGGGKSSLIKLVERFYDPKIGQVLLDGRPLASYHPAWLRRQVALVGQEPVLYARSVRRNIVLGLESDAEVDTHEARRLAKQAKEKFASQSVSGGSESLHARAWRTLKSSREMQFLHLNDDDNSNNNNKLVELHPPLLIDLKDFDMRRIHNPGEEKEEVPEAELQGPIHGGMFRNWHEAQQEGAWEADGGGAPDMAAIMEAARLANAHEFITAMPDGYETECGERGQQLSGGQKQRIAIARALVRAPAVLLLDEATSALDAGSEAQVQEAIDNVMVDRTVLVIAHRLSTIQNAGRIVVIQKGMVAEEGTHEELVSNNGVYYNLVRRQLQGSSSSRLMLMNNNNSASTSSLQSLESN